MDGKWGNNNMVFTGIFFGGICRNIGYDSKHFQHIGTGCNNIFFGVVEETACYGVFDGRSRMRLFAYGKH